ncbi:MAG: hypothetical protein ACLPUG_15920 [Acidimicrobiales bacterium]
MPERFVALPRHQVKAVSLVEAGEAEDGRDTLNLVVGEGTDDERLGAGFDDGSSLGVLPNDCGPTPFDAGDTGRYSRVAAPRPDARASAATTRARLGTPTVSSGERFPQLHGWTMG